MRVQIKLTVMPLHLIIAVFLSHIFHTILHIQKNLFLQSGKTHFCLHTTAYVTMFRTFSDCMLADLFSQQLTLCQFCSNLWQHMLHYYQAHIVDQN